MTRLNFTLGYKFDFEGYDARVRFGVLNVEDERAPLADEFWFFSCLLYTSPSPRDRTRSRMPSSA